jgi:hypothetical protein
MNSKIHFIFRGFQYLPLCQITFNNNSHKSRERAYFFRARPGPSVICTGPAHSYSGPTWIRLDLLWSSFMLFYVKNCVIVIHNMFVEVPYKTWIDRKYARDCEVSFGFSRYARAESSPKSPTYKKVVLNKLLEWPGLFSCWADWFGAIFVSGSEMKIDPVQ